MFIILKNYMNFIKFYHFYLRGLFLFRNLEKVVANLPDKSEYIIHIRHLNQALNHGLVLKKVHRVIKFDQNAWIKAYIDMKTDLRKVAKYNLEKYFFKLMNHAIFGKTTGNVKKHRDVKLVSREKTRNYLVSEPNYLTTNFFYRTFFLVLEMKRTHIIMNKPAYLGL